MCVCRSGSNSNQGIFYWIAVASYPINKGVGRSVEVRGLRAQYVIYATVGTVAILLFVFMVCICGSMLFALGVGAVALIAVWSSCFYLNRKYGEHGLLQRVATKRIPLRISLNRSILQLVHHEKNNR